MANHVLQYHVFAGSPLTPSAVTIVITNAVDGTPATLFNDRDGLDPVPGHEFIVTNGRFRVYVPSGRYNIKAFNNSGSNEFLDIDAGQWSQ
jgi:hypothetical protein